LKNQSHVYHISLCNMNGFLLPTRTLNIAILLFHFPSGQEWTSANSNNIERYTSEKYVSPAVPQKWIIGKVWSALGNWEFHKSNIIWKNKILENFFMFFETKFYKHRTAFLYYNISYGDHWRFHFDFKHTAKKHSERVDYNTHIYLLYDDNNSKNNNMRAIINSKSNFFCRSIPSKYKLRPKWFRWLKPSIQ